ncbi:ATP-binding protein [Algivirga pacifica]|uniref:Helix-turn-helix domain-containing protein n=1 Tax=Algivirga pacifica TaxID=1162670 RepID=A0ABP9DDA5_9BACT
MEVEELRILIEELRALPQESEWVEFKENNTNPQRIGAYISGLANSANIENKEYAYLIYGIKDDTQEVVGTTFKPREEKIGNQELENWLVTQLNPPVGVQIFEFSYKERPLVLFQIEPALNRPVHFKGVAYVRVGSYLKNLKDHPDKESKIWQKTKQVVFEKELAMRNLFADKVLELLDYPSVFKLLNTPLPTDKSGILEKLLEEKLIEKRFNKYHITNLGAILFANDLHKFEKLARKTPRVIVYKGNNKLHTIKEQEGHLGYAVAFERLVDYVNDKLPSNEEIGRVFREKVNVYPELAIRELLANALIHQDFSIRGAGVMIEIFDNRIEITNPGKPLIDTKRFLDHSPESRNEQLASLMRRMGICEERGSGIDKVIAQIEVYQLPAPDFISGDNFTRVVLYSPKTLRQMSKQDKLRAVYQHCSLKYISGEYMTNQSLRERFDVDKKNYPVISRLIKEAVNEGVIKEYDNSRMYVPFWGS